MGQFLQEGGVFSGVGSDFFDSGAFYFGEWREAKLNGVGVFIFSVEGYVRGHF